MSRLRKLVLAATAATAAPALGQSCPPPLDAALRLVLVTTPDMESSKARLQLFERNSLTAPWRPVSSGEPAMVGEMGLAWGFTFIAYKREGEPEKVEGDKRTPAGFFKLGPSFGFAKVKRDNYIAVEPETVCVEDPASPLYNTITTRAQLAPETKADNMRDTSLFRNGLFVDYPSDRQGRRGSCIFIHVWKTPGTKTSGCMALPEPRVKALQAFSEGRAVVLGILPETARERFSGCLPVSVAPTDEDTHIAPRR